MNKWIDFGKPVLSKTGKTKIWQVESSSDAFCIGEIRWYGRWRGYAFYPEMSTIFEQKCLREIADFCEKQTKITRQSWSKK